MVLLQSQGDAAMIDTTSNEPNETRELNVEELDVVAGGCTAARF
jgi:hypothetical protein